MMNKIFSSLKVLGFNDVEDLEIYSKEEQEKKEKKKEKEKEIDINTLLYDAKVKCPVCSTQFTSRVVKTSAVRIESRDSDTFIRYKTINPYFYDVWICPICGYANLKADYYKIKSYQKEIIKMKISNQWRGKKYPPIYDAKIAIERYKLALLNAVLGEFKDSSKAIICLKIAWIYRIQECKSEEKDYLRRALEGFLLAYKNEDTPFYGLDSYSLMYLIGELYRRIDDYENANQWFGKVITSIGAGHKIKEKARDMRELSLEMKCKLEDEAMRNRG